MPPFAGSVALAVRTMPVTPASLRTLLRLFHITVLTGGGVQDQEDLETGGLLMTRLIRQAHP